ncbi:MAG: protein kinase family protein [Candidatus Stygibacter australis]|nr:protein kinase family protein [Candidatus Stygibacter australis]MDP8323256.1 protein kinase family protein [Candidatus Stygibacter australis]
MLTENEIIKFTRNKDLTFVKYLNRGGFGITVLLRDEEIDTEFVCKKYSPEYESQRSDFYSNFINEIKLMHLLYHRNVVRIFNFYLYPKTNTGFIVMEYIDGHNIEEYLKKHPEEINSIFLQTVQAFEYLELNNILHRDIRGPNILVTPEGNVKVIDFGFGKEIKFDSDEKKSINLNWWCSLPDEFSDNIYNHSTEIYFIGKLFELLITNNNITTFEYSDILRHMICSDPSSRLGSASEINKQITTREFSGINFLSSEKLTYQQFADMLLSVIGEIFYDAKYIDEIQQVINNLEKLKQNTLLEDNLFDNRKLIYCFIDGGYSFRSNVFLEMDVIRNFVQLMIGNPLEKQNIIYNNLKIRLDSIQRTQKDDEVPF